MLLFQLYFNYFCLNYLANLLYVFEPGAASASGFLKLLLCGSQYVCLCMCVCPPPRLSMTSGVICTQYDWLNKFYSFYMEAVVDIVSRSSLCTDVWCTNQGIG